MSLKRRNRAIAEFNMSSLTDIIFLLLIFFMLTSSLVAPNALNLKLPGSSKTKVVATDRLDDVRIDRRGRFYLNGKRISPQRLETELRRKASRVRKGKLNITISPDKNTPVEHVVTVMDIAMRLDINGILAPEQ